MTRSVRGRRDARGIALQAIFDFESRGAFVIPTVEELARVSSLGTADRGLAMELACGFVRRRMTLEAVLTAYSSRALDNIDPEIRAVLCLGIYQLLFLNRIPAHAALHETVQLCHRMGMRQTAGFVNGILRNLLRDLPAQPMSLSGLADCRDSTVPVPRLGPEGLTFEGLNLGRQVFADPRLSPDFYLAEAFSLPEWLVERWGSRCSRDEIFHLGGWFTTPGTSSIRGNLLRTTVEQCKDVLRAAGVVFQPGRYPESLCTGGSLNVENLPGFAEGWFSVQDESAMSAVDLLNPQPGEKILDLCAAPGGKSTFLAERMQNTGSILACDTSGPRLKMIEGSISRLGLSSISLQKIREDGLDIPAGPFDAVLLDVPCSNTGVLGKRPEARWRTSPGSLKELLPLQRRLLTDALQRVGPGGRVVYSTCSIEPEENQGVVQATLVQFPNCQLVAEKHHVPGQPADGAYQALIRVPAV